MGMLKRYNEQYAQNPGKVTLRCSAELCSTRNATTTCCSSFSGLKLNRLLCLFVFLIVVCVSLFACTCLEPKNIIFCTVKVAFELVIWLEISENFEGTNTALEKDGGNLRSRQL